jgi:hypothetical protein
MDRRKLFLAVAALVVVVLAAFGLATNSDRGITRNPDRVDTADAGETAGPSLDERQLQQLCASSATAARLKQVAFEEAFRVRNADPTNLDRLAASSVVRMENTEMRSFDDSSAVVTCAGRFVLELPPGAERAFNGERRLVADVEYSAQTGTADGTVFQLNGAEPLIYRLASFDMQNAPPQPVPLGEEVELAEAVPPAIGGPEDEEEIEEPQEAPTPRATAEPTPRPSPRATSRPTPRPTPRETQAAKEREEPPARRRASSNPSFNCRYARSRSETMVCESSRLAAKDRAMSSVFYSALDNADPRQRRELRRTRDRFLAYRDRCPNEACVAEAYDGRIEEIRDIMRDLE